MIEIRNLLFQPLTFQLLGAEEGLHIHSREIRQILEEHVSEEILSAVARGFVELTQIGSPEQPTVADTAESVDQPADTPVVEEVAQPAEETAVPEAAPIEEPVMMSEEMLSESPTEVVESADAGTETTDSADTTTTRKRR